MIITTQFGQTLMDIAVQYYGNANAIIELAADNGLTISDEIEAGTDLIIRDQKPDNAAAIFADYISDSGIVVVSKQGEDSFNVLANNEDDLITDNDSNSINV